MKRRMVAILMMVLLVSLAMTTSVSGAKVKLSVTICCEQLDRAEWLQAVSDAYMKENPNVEVQPLVNVGMAQLTTMIAGGVAPDLMWVGQSWGSQIGYLANLNEFFAKESAFTRDLVPGMLKGFQYNGASYAIPFSASSRAIAYNEDLFMNAGLRLPAKTWTWDEAMTMAKRLTRDTNGDGSPDTWGIALNWQPWAFFAYGGTIYKDNNRNANIRQDAILEGVRIWQDAWSGRTGVMPSGYVGESADPGELFTQGRLAMWDIGIFEVPFLRERATFSWDVQEPPLLNFRGQLLKGGAWTGEGYGLYKDTKNRDEALRFAKFMLSRQWLSRLTEKGAIMPASVSTLNTAFLQSKQPPANLKAFVDALDYEFAAWAHPAFGNVMDRMFQPIWNQDAPHSGTKPVEMLLEESQKALQQALDTFFGTTK